MIKKWEIKLCISVNIYCRLPKLGMSTQISLCYDNKWEIKLCISVNIYSKLGQSYKNINISVGYQHFCTKPSEQGSFF